MKKYIFLLCLIPFLFSCTEDESVDITVMPEETTIGADTFGCLVDGWLYVGGRYSLLTRPSINFDYISYNKTMQVNVWVKADMAISFCLDKPEENKEIPYTQFTWGDETLSDGKVFITRFDSTAQIISGRFEGERVTFGRFDVHYSK